MKDQPIALLLSAFIAMIPASSEAAEPVKIEISSKWGGLGEPANFTLTIRKDKGDIVHPKASFPQRHWHH